MEEIDIIELLNRVKEGKAPKEIEINNNLILGYTHCNDIFCLYRNGDNYWSHYYIDFDTKIKILDKPIIEELKGNASDITDGEAFNKINEIIRYLNKEEK